MGLQHGSSIPAWSIQILYSVADVEYFLAKTKISLSFEMTSVVTYFIRADQQIWYTIYRWAYQVETCIWWDQVYGSLVGFWSLMYTNTFDLLCCDDYGDLCLCYMFHWWLTCVENAWRIWCWRPLLMPCFTQLLNFSVMMVPCITCLHPPSTIHDWFFRWLMID